MVYIFVAVTSYCMVLLHGHPFRSIVLVPDPSASIFKIDNFFEEWWKGSGIKPHEVVWYVTMPLASAPPPKMADGFRTKTDLEHLNNDTFSRKQSIGRFNHDGLHQLHGHSVEISYSMDCF